MPKRDNNFLVKNLIISFKKILSYTDGMTYDTFIEDDKTIDAVVRNFEIIGEAANLLSNDFKVENNQVEWRKSVDFRNRLIHEYFGVDYEIVW